MFWFCGSCIFGCLGTCFFCLYIFIVFYMLHLLVFILYSCNRFWRQIMIFLSVVYSDSLQRTCWFWKYLMFSVDNLEPQIGNWFYHRNVGQISSFPIQITLIRTRYSQLQIFVLGTVGGFWDFSCPFLASHEYFFSSRFMQIHILVLYSSGLCASGPVCRILGWTYSVPCVALTVRIIFFLPYSWCRWWIQLEWLVNWYGMLLSWIWFGHIYFGYSESIFQLSLMATSIFKFLWVIILFWDLWHFLLSLWYVVRHFQTMYTLPALSDVLIVLGVLSEFCLCMSGCPIPLFHLFKFFIRISNTIRLLPLTICSDIIFCLYCTMTYLWLIVFWIYWSVLVIHSNYFFNFIKTQFLKQE